MWSILLGLIERWWREKPRLDVARSVVDLRDAMEACHTSYLAYHTAKTSRTQDLMQLQGLRVEWGYNIEDLGKAVLNLGTVLRIFSPGLHRKLIEYSNDESNSYEIADDALYLLASTMGQAPEIDIAQIELSVGFQTALTELDSFIRTNFKLEEVYAVKSRRFH